MRKAFSMLTAIFVMILMAGLAVFILNISQKAISTTVFQYKKEQAVLWAKSYTELAIMAATANDSNVSNCAESIDGNVSSFGTADVDKGIGYAVRADISYIGNGLACTNDHILNTVDINTTDSLHIIVDVFVRYKNPTIVDLAGSAPWVTYHRRTLQKL